MVGQRTSLGLSQKEVRRTDLASTDAKRLKRDGAWAPTLEELRATGLITYRLSTEDLTGPEPHLDVYAERDTLDRQAPSDLSEGARLAWDQMREGRI